MLLHSLKNASILFIQFHKQQHLNHLLANTSILVSYYCLPAKPGSWMNSCIYVFCACTQSSTIRITNNDLTLRWALHPVQSSNYFSLQLLCCLLETKYFVIILTFSNYQLPLQPMTLLHTLLKNKIVSIGKNSFFHHLLYLYLYFLNIFHLV